MSTINLINQAMRMENKPCFNVFVVLCLSLQQPFLVCCDGCANSERVAEIRVWWEARKAEDVFKHVMGWFKSSTNWGGIGVESFGFSKVDIGWECLKWA